MKQYKGYYIDNVVFDSESAIDQFLYEKALEAYKLSHKLFKESPSIEGAEYISQRAWYLHDEFGVDWATLESIELEVYKN